MNNKIYLCSFASEDLNKSVDRFEFQAKKMNIYSGIKIFKPKDLDPQLLKRVNNIIKQKGKYLYGYAIWKPAIVKNYLQELEDDAILQYSDIGCHLNYKGFERLNDYNLSGVFHCFTGNLEEAQRIINLNNFYLGIGGVVTFKNGGINKIINQVSLDRIILETDSPYLSPTPFRGTRNESRYLLNIAHKMAELYNIDIEDIAKKTTKNAIDLFHL